MFTFQKKVKEISLHKKLYHIRFTILILHTRKGRGEHIREGRGGEARQGEARVLSVYCIKNGENAEFRNIISSL